VRRFRYCRDPLFLTACVLYAANRLWGKGHLHVAFLHNQFNDLLLIPCALPPVLWLQRRFGMRNNDAPPTLWEMSFHLVIWSVIFEVIGPHISHATGDFRDILAYAAGALVSALVWHKSSKSVAAA
jgi:hypothetical protein